MDEEQAENLDRVRTRIHSVVTDFCREHVGNQFHMVDLTEYVRERAHIAPDSPGRILRDLRRTGILDYEVLNRRESLYEIRRVHNVV